MSEFLDALKEYQIKATFHTPLRVILEGGDKSARKHYQKVLRENPEWEVDVILELAKNNSDLRYILEERAAISELNSLREAAKMLMRFEE